MSTKLRYPYNWGKKHVNQFAEKYPRGWNNLCGIVLVAPGKLRHYATLIICSGQSINWEAFKYVVKQMQDYSAADIGRIPEIDRKELYKRLIYLGQDEFLDEKTAE